MIKLGKAITAITDITVWSLLKARIHIFAFAILLIAINRAAGLVWPYLSKYLIDDVIANHSQSLLIIIVVAGASATVVQGVSAYLINRTVTISSLRLVADLRNRIHDHVLRLSVAYYDEKKTGALVSRMMNDVEGVRNLIGGGFVTFLGATLTASIAFIVLLQVNALMTLSVFLVLAPFGLLLKNALRKYRPLFRDANNIRAELSGRLTESLSGIRVVKVYRAESQEHQGFKSEIARHLEKMIVAFKGQGLLDLTVVVLTGVVSALVAYLGGSNVMSGKMTLGDFFRYIMFMSLLVQPILQVVSVGTQFNEALAGLDRVRELLAEPREDQDASRAIRTGEIKGEVAFESVSFSYGEKLPVLHEVSFRAEPGTITALVGPSGAGKSTITGLIASFYRACGGTIWVDDIDISRVNLDSYRAQLGIVPQDPFLFSGTIRENVALSRPCSSDEEIINACCLAHVDEFAARFEDAYETRVGERGVKLSMGQRQRIAIARAILANPKILILDEATSSLDSVSEAVIQQALTFLLRDRTTFVIAHRLSTIRQADQILVIDGGRIVECGTHESLFRARGKYWELYTTQYATGASPLLAQDEDECLPVADPRRSSAN